MEYRIIHGIKFIIMDNRRKNLQQGILAFWKSNTDTHKTLLLDICSIKREWI